MSPLSASFASRLRQFPSLVNCCTLDWFSEWPEEALLGVGKGAIQASFIFYFLQHIVGQHYNHLRMIPF